MKKVTFIFVFLLCSIGAALAQTVTVKGRVTDASGEPIIGASVIVKGSKTGTVTDKDGQYTLRIGPKDRLVVSYIGKESVEVTPINGVCNCSLNDDVRALDDIVVVAYGTQQRRNLTGAIASVSSDQIIENPVASLESALQGKMSGVQVTNATGAPGGAVVINIRGTSSISAGNDPLYVVDGLPIISTDISQKGGYQGNSISGIVDINPNDIESIQVLKDASASALYGSRASNGVVLITTKKGRAEKTKVTLSSYVGFNDTWRKVKYLNAAEHVAARNEAIDNYNTSLGLTPADGAYKEHVAAGVAGADTDWIDEVTQSAIQTSHQLSATGGNNQTQFFISGGYLYQEGLVKQTDYTRFNLRANFGHQVSSKLHIDANIALSSSENNRSTGDNNIYSPWINAHEVSADYPIYAQSGDWSSVNNGLYNPVQLLYGQEQVTKKYRAVINLKGTYHIIPGLDYHLNLGGDYNIMHEIGYFPSTSVQGATSKGETTDYRGFTFTQLAEHTLTYKIAWQNATLDALVGYSYQKTKIDNNYVRGINFLSPTLKYIDSAGEISTGSSSLSEYALQSLFGRVNLSLYDKYLIEASLRSDASSKFAKGNRVGYFPAGSVGWRISNESFFPQSKAVSDLKIRASIGYTGNQEGIGYYEYHNIYRASGVKYEGNPGLGFAYYKPNPDLTWEKTLQYGVGIDASLLRDRISVTFDWYKKDTHDLLLTHSINSLSGYSDMTSNVGSVTNTGLELTINSHNLTGAFKWDTNFNISWTKNKVTELAKDAEGNDVDIEDGYCNIIRVGESLAAFYLIKQEGIYQTKEEILSQPGGQALWDSGIRPGDVKYYDANGDGTINNEDRVLCGTPFPKFYGAIGNSFSYKGFDLNIDLQYSLGHKLYAGWKQYSNGAGNLGGAASGAAIFKGDWDDRWTGEGTSNSVPRAVATGTAYNNNFLTYTTRFLEDADFLRIRNITLGYTLPQRATHALGISKLRLYGTITNLFTFTKYDGYDPEVQIFPDRTTYRGYDAGAVPQPRSFVFGLNLTF